MESEYQFLPNLENNVLLPIPCAPHNTRTESNFIPDSKTLATAAVKVFTVTLRTYSVFCAPR